MPDKKILRGIKPFNKFFFRSCYYHQLISAYARYGTDERLILMNYFPLYDKENWQVYNGLSIFTDKELEELSGIRLIKKKDVADIVKELIASIDCGAPVILSVDCYYLPYRDDMYKKRHTAHFLLVYGYDKARKKFIVNEHNFVNSILYKEREVDFGVVKTAFANYTKRLDKGQGMGFIKIKKVAGKKYEFSPEYYLSAYIKNKAAIRENLNNLISYCDEVVALLLNQDELLGAIEKTYIDFAFILHKKRMQWDQFSAIFNDDEIDELNSRCVESLLFIYSILAKIKFANFYNSKSIEKIAARLKEVKTIEQKIYEILDGKTA